jgi:hypothetical protein
VSIKTDENPENPKPKPWALQLWLTEAERARADELAMQRRIADPTQPHPTKEIAKEAFMRGLALLEGEKS